MMNAARARRLYQHVMNGGQLSENDALSLVASIEEREREIQRLRNALDGKSAQAYQVIGDLLLEHPNNVAEAPEAIRALDYFSDTLAYDEEFLPWRLEEAKGIGDQ